MLLWQLTEMSTKITKTEIKIKFKKNGKKLKIIKTKIEILKLNINKCYNTYKILNTEHYVSKLNIAFSTALM